MLYVFMLLGNLNFTTYFRTESFLFEQHPFGILQAGGMLNYDLGHNMKVHVDGSVFRTFEKDTLSYRDMFSRSIYYPYSYDPQPVISTHRLFEVMFTSGYISYKRNNLSLKIGRDTIRWPSRLFIYGNSYQFSFLYNFQYSGKKISFVTFNASLLDTIDLKRMAAQLVIIKPHRNLDVFLAEGVIYTRPNLLKYVNPVAPYYAIQRTSDDGPENLIGLVGIRYKNVKFFFLNDDFIIDKGGTSKYGTELDVKYKSLEFSFIRIPRYTYTHFTDTNSWAINAVPIGYPYGPDVLDFYIRGNFPRWSVELTYLNHGEGRITEHWEYSGMPKNPPVPSGIVERTFGIMVKHNINFGNAGLFFYNIDNYENIPGIKEKRLGIYFNLLFKKTFELL